jgi:hypothetical protein
MTQVFINREEEEDKKNKTKKGKRMNASLLQARQWLVYLVSSHHIDPILGGIQSTGDKK